MDIKKYGKSMALKFYREMKILRTFELSAVKLFRQGLIAGNLHTYIGQEAIAVGACQALKATDYIVSTHRGHGHCLAKGCEPDKMMAELLGKETGYCKGRGGSMHISDINLGILGANGIVGGGIPIGTGSALASKIANKDEVTLIFFGDGASNQGAFHESLNMASAWNLPAVFLCENNKYGVSVCIDRVTKVKDLAVRAQAYDIPGVVIDGNDVFAVYEAMQNATVRARKGEGPTLIEAKTYRYHGHYEGDPQIYKPAEEVEQWKNRDCLDRLRSALLDAEPAVGEELDKIDQEIEEMMSNAVEFAQSSPYPAPESISQYVYATENERGVAR